MASQDEISLYYETLDRGCCQRCALRYLCLDPHLSSFEYPDTTLVNFGILSPFEEFHDPPSKRKRTNPCSVCLGVLQDSLIDKMLSDEKLKTTSQYKSTYYVTHLSSPAAILIRDHSMKLHLKRMFPEAFKCDNILKFKNAWKSTIDKRLSKILNKTSSHVFNTFKVHFFVNYDLDNDELAVIYDFMRKSNYRKNFSKHAIKHFLDNVSEEDFSSLVTIPPKIPFSSATYSRVELCTEYIFLLGNFCKYSRDLPQTNLAPDGPIIDNKPTIENIIVKAAEDVLGTCDEITFTTSGYETPTVRILGSGRSFQLKILGKEFPEVPLSKCKEIEKAINRNKNVFVKNLHQTEKKEIIAQIECEKRCSRSFKLLCIVEDSSKIDRGISAINMYRNLIISQKTPIVKLHQRELHLAKKEISYIKARKVKDNLFEVDIIALSNVFVEEFVHGDFGRTTPSLSEIMKTRVDIVTYDITDFHTTLTCALDEEEVDI